MNRKILSALLAFSLSAALAGCGSSGESVTVESVARICGVGSIGVAERFAGVVVSGETEKIKKDSTKTVLDVLVEVGDDVKKGDTLFTYDKQAMEFALEKLKLELETANNTVTYSRQQLETLQQQLTWTYASQKPALELQIATLEADIKEAEYNIILKERDIANAEKAMGSTEVKSPMGGRITAINQSSSGSGTGSESGSGSGNDNSNTSDAFITVTDMNSFRVEGKINETNVGALNEGMNVIIRSRVNNEQLWRGCLATIDWDNPVSNNSSSMFFGGGSDSGSSSSSYKFYVTLESHDGLILGQHVYIEPDNGQADRRSGIWLPEYYLFDTDGGSAHVWAENSRGKLEKRALTLGEYDAGQQEYEITGGLELLDYIAYPAEGVGSGMKTAHYDPSSEDDISEAGYGGDEYYEESPEDGESVTDVAELPSVEGGEEAAEDDIIAAGEPVDAPEAEENDSLSDETAGADAPADDASSGENAKAEVAA